MFPIIITIILSAEFVDQSNAPHAEEFQRIVLVETQTCPAGNVIICVANDNAADYFHYSSNIRRIPRTMLTQFLRRTKKTFRFSFHKKNWKLYLPIPNHPAQELLFASRKKYVLQQIIDPDRNGIFTPSKSRRWFSGKGWFEAKSTWQSNKLNTKISRKCCQKKRKTRGVIIVHEIKWYSPFTDFGIKLSYESIIKVIERTQIRAGVKHRLR